MVLQKADWNLNVDIFRKAGVDVDDPSLLEKKLARDKEMEKKFYRDTVQAMNRAVWKKSLWDSGEIAFSFSEWKPDQRDNPQLAKTLGRKAYTLAKEMQTGHMNVVMSGNAGVGKTSLALAMINLLRNSGKQAMFVSISAFSQLVAEQYDYKDKKVRLKEVVEAMKRADVLLLDDLGSDAGSIERVAATGDVRARKDVQSLLFDIANNRYEGTPNERKRANEKGIKLLKPVHQTIITTNNTTDELVQIYGERTISRLITRDPNHRLPFNHMEDMRAKEGI